MGAGRAAALTHIVQTVLPSKHKETLSPFEGGSQHTGLGEKLIRGCVDTDWQLYPQQAQMIQKHNWWSHEATKWNNKTFSECITMQLKAQSGITRLVGQLWGCQTGTPGLHFALWVCVCLCIQGLVPGSLRSPSTTVPLFFSGASENRINDQQQGHEKVVSTSHQDFTALGVCQCVFFFLEQKDNSTILLTNLLSKKTKHVRTRHLILCVICKANSHAQAEQIAS